MPHIHRIAQRLLARIPAPHHRVQSSYARWSSAQWHCVSLYRFERPDDTSPTPAQDAHTVFDLHSPCRPCPRWPWQAACACPSDVHLFQHLRHRMPSWGLHVQLSSFGILTTCSSNSLQLRRRLFLSTQINSINFVMRCTATSIHALHRPSLYF